MRGPTTGRPSNGALAEALFRLADSEPLGDRRLSLLKAGYTAMDAAGAARGRVIGEAPAWLRPVVGQLMACAGDGALEAAVERLAGPRSGSSGTARERFLSRAEVDEVLRHAPEELQPQRLRGAFHWHTRDSDGHAPLEVMARACRRRGAEWAVVADHSRGLEVASGLDAEGVRLQRRRIDRWNRDHAEELLVLQGLEVEVGEDGTVDVPPLEREELACPVAAVHSGVRETGDQTGRLLRAIDTPGVRVLAHPRARLFHHRSGIRARWERVFDACAANDVAVEINGFPRRQDLDWELARLAADRGCRLILASDAHAPRHLEFDAYACAIAARGGVPAEAILNFQRVDVVLGWLGIDPVA